MSIPSHKKPTSSILTSKREGLDLSELTKLWRDIASSEERLKLMTELKKRKVGFNEIEEFSLGLKYNLKSEKMRDPSNKPTQKVTAAAMEMKMRDESLHHKEMTKRKEKMRRWLAKMIHPKTHKYRMVIRDLRREAEEIRKICREKYRKKLNHLENKYTEKEEEEEEQPPPGMEKLSNLSIFRKDKFEELELVETEVAKIGEITISEAEEKILRRPPKFALPEKLLEHTLRDEMEKAYAKMRMELRDEEVEEEHELNKELDKPIIVV